MKQAAGWGLVEICSWVPSHPWKMVKVLSRKVHSHDIHIIRRKRGKHCNLSSIIFHHDILQSSNPGHLPVQNMLILLHPRAKLLSLALNVQSRLGEVDSRGLHQPLLWSS